MKTYRSSIGPINEYGWPLSTSLTCPKDHWPTRESGVLEYVQIIFASQALIRVGLPYGNKWASNKYDRRDLRLVKLTYGANATRFTFRNFWYDDSDPILEEADYAVTVDMAEGGTYKHLIYTRVDNRP